MLNGFWMELLLFSGFLIIFISYSQLFNFMPPDTNRKWLCKLESIIPLNVANVAISIGNLSIDIHNMWNVAIEWCQWGARIVKILCGEGFPTPLTSPTPPHTSRWNFQTSSGSHNRYNEVCNLRQRPVAVTFHLVLPSWRGNFSTKIHISITDPSNFQILFSKIPYFCFSHPSGNPSLVGLSEYPPPSEDLSLH